MDTKLSRLRDRILSLIHIYLYKPGYDIYTGHGNVNACRAVAAAAGVSDGLKVPQLARPKSVKAYSAGPHAIKLSWKKVPRANGYFIYRSDKKDGSYHRIKRIRRGKILSFRDTGRKFDKKFYYKIVAYGTTRDEMCIRDSVYTAEAFLRSYSFFPDAYPQSSSSVGT